jgi:protease I
MSNVKLSRRQWCGLLVAGLAAFGMTVSGVSAEGKKQPKKLGKVLMPIGDATEAMDTLYPFFRLAEEGYEVVVAGPEARLYHMVLHEVPPNSDVPWDLTQERPGYHIQATIAFRDVKPEEYVGLFLSGGRAPEYIRYDKDLMRITKHFVKEKKPIAVVCHGIEIIAAAGGLEGGRRATTVGKCALDITQTGGVYVNEPCVVDGNVVSASTWHDYDTQFFKIFIKKMQESSDR